VAIEVKERKTCRVRLERISDASANSLKGFTERNIEHSSTIVTDGWLGYSELEEMGYLHKVQKSTVNEDDEEILPYVHRVASLLKRWLIGTHQSYLNKNKLGYYLNEYVFRYNRRTLNSRGLLFMRLLEQAVITEPVTYDEIIRENQGL
jgi:transposase-like protein